MHAVCPRVPGAGCYRNLHKRMTAPASPLHRLHIFEGTWRTHGHIVNGEAPATEFSGTDTYTWLPGRFFMLHQVDVMMGQDHNQTTEIIGYDPRVARYTLHYFDNQGGQGLAAGRMGQSEWTITDDTLRFRGHFDKAGYRLSGAWQRSDNGKEWKPFLTIELNKV